MNMESTGYGSSWQRALYRGFPASVPDIVKKYPRAPRSTVALPRRGLGADISITFSNTIGDDAISQAVDNVLSYQDPTFAVQYLSDPTIALTQAQHDRLIQALNYLPLTPQGPTQFVGPTQAGGFDASSLMLLAGLGVAAFILLKK
jgi:hypothetical protein